MTNEVADLTHWSREVCWYDLVNCNKGMSWYGKRIVMVELMGMTLHMAIGKCTHMSQYPAMGKRIGMTQRITVSNGNGKTLCEKMD